jgi:outer membrane lipoprotein-sorting protein
MPATTALYGMARTRTLLVTALLALALVVSGCQTGPSTSVPEETPTADELRQQTLSAMEDVETATLTMDMTIEADGRTIEMTGDGTMNRSAKLMRMSFDVSAGSRDIQATQYIDDDTMYMKVNDQWQSMNVREMTGQDPWANNQLAQQEAVLEGAEVRINGTTTVEDRHVYRLEVEANESVARSLMQQSAAGATGSMENVEIDRFQFTQYVDVETKHVRKIDMEMDMTVQGQQANSAITMTFSDFNEDVTIQVPEEATSA